VLATATTASTAAAGYDSDILEVVSPTAVGSLKNNLPLGFVPLSEDIKIRMLSSLDTNSSSANINSFGKSTLKGIIDDIVVVKGDLLQHAAGVDKIYRDMLDDVIPDHVGMKMKKHCMCKTSIHSSLVDRFAHCCAKTLRRTSSTRWDSVRFVYVLAHSSVIPRKLFIGCFFYVLPFSLNNASCYSFQILLKQESVFQYGQVQKSSCDEESIRFLRQCCPSSAD
jgi:hypothetical protein